MLAGAWDRVRGATWDETYAKLGSGGMNGEGVGEAGVFTRKYILALNPAADLAQIRCDRRQP